MELSTILSHTSQNINFPQNIYLEMLTPASSIAAIAISSVICFFFLLWIFNLFFPGTLPLGFLFGKKTKANNGDEENPQSSAKAKKQIESVSKKYVEVYQAKPLAANVVSGAQLERTEISGNPSASQKCDSPISRSQSTKTKPRQSTNEAPINFSTSEQDRKIGIPSGSLGLGKCGPESARNSIVDSRNGAASEDPNENGVLAKLSKKIKSNSSINAIGSSSKLGSKELIHGAGDESPSMIRRVQSLSRFAPGSQKSINGSQSQSKLFQKFEDTNQNPQGEIKNSTLSRSGSQSVI